MLGSRGELVEKGCLRELFPLPQFLNAIGYVFEECSKYMVDLHQSSVNRTLPQDSFF